MKQINKHTIILASKSPRRQQLLREMDIDFKIKTKDVEEDFPESLSNREVAIFLCEKKAAAFSESEISDNEILITADTIVCLGNTILNKPGDRAHAIEMLSNLSGTMHEVITGVCLRSRTKTHSFFDSTKVYFRTLLPDEIAHYVDNYKPFDKAGAYGIQEWIGLTGIQKVEGSYFNVVGLPTEKLYKALLEF
jgi:septum formation protein